MTTPTQTDVEHIIRDQVRAQLAEQMIDASRKATEAGDKARRDGTKVRAPGEESAVVDRASMQVLHDPLKGKGLAFARWVKVRAAAASQHRPERELAGEWAKMNRDYAEVADLLAERAMSEGSMSAGGALVPPQFASEIIELLYAKTLGLMMGARTLEFNGSIDIGRINSGATVGYVGESTNLPVTQPALGQLKLTRKKAAALVVLTNELLRNPAIGADVIVRDDLVQALALRRDLSIFRGAGTEYQPKGITNWVRSSNKNASAGTTLANKVTDLMTAIRLVDESNVPMDSAGFAFSPRTLWALAATLDGQGKFVFADMINTGKLFGFPFGKTTQIPNNLGAGSDSEIYFGAFNDIIVGFDIGTPMTVEMFPNGAYYDGSAQQSGISNDTSPVRVLEGHDVLLRHDNSFAMVTGVQYS